MTSVRSLVFAFVTLAAALFVLPAPPSAEASATAEPVLVIDGKGNGHGVGLSQDGALAMGREGAGTDEILAKFYPGTEVAAAGGVLGVRILESAAARVDVTFPGGGEVRAFPDGPQPAGYPITVRPGGTATVSLEDGSFHAASDDEDKPEVAMPAARLIVDDSTTPSPADDGSTTSSTSSTTSSTTPSTLSSTLSSTMAPTTTTTIDEQATSSPPILEDPTTTTSAEAPPPSGPPGPAPDPPSTDQPGARAPSAEGLWLVPDGGSTIAVPVRDRRYRGVIEVTGSSLGGLQLVNRLDVEEYLRGMGEVLDPTWPPAALRAQAIAARTYALRATRAGGTICDDDRCQVYLGAAVEYPAMDEAVADSASQVLVFGGGLASTVYSASAGGVTATPREGFGSDGSDYPYLPSTPYTAVDPPVWSTTIALSDLGRLLDYPGNVRAATVSAAGPSGRALEVVLDGDAGRRTVDGLRFASRMDLHSTLFSFRTTIGTPTPTPGGRSIQAPPDAAAHLPPLLERVVGASAGSNGPDLAHAGRSVLLLGAASLLGVESRRRRRIRGTPTGSPATR